MAKIYEQMKVALVIFKFMTWANLRIGREKGALGRTARATDDITSRSQSLPQG